MEKEKTIWQYWFKNFLSSSFVFIRFSWERGVLTVALGSICFLLLSLFTSITIIFLIIAITAITIIKYIIHQFVLLSLASAFYLINCLCPDSLLILNFYFPVCTCSPYNLNYQFVNFLSVYLCHFLFLTTLRLTQFIVTAGAEFKSDW